jgi:hypothetical protein
MELEHPLLNPSLYIKMMHTTFLFVLLNKAL